MGVRWLILLLLALLAACDRLETLVPALTMPEQTEMNETVTKELARIRVLLAPERARTTLEEAEPILPAEAVGARAALGFRTPQPEVVVSVYVFDSWNQHAAAVTLLQAQLPADAAKVLHATNGPSLFFGYTRVPGFDAGFRLSDLVSAFAGDE